MSPRLALPVLCALAGAASAADWSLAPHFGLNGEYNTNPYLQSQATGNRSGGTFDASLPLGAKTETTEFTLGLSARLRHYNNDAFQNRDDERLSTTIKQTGERHSWSGSAAWARDTTLTSELGTTGLTQSNTRHNRYEASISPQIQVSERGLVNFGISGEVNRYQDARLIGLVDYSYASVFGGYTHLAGERTSVGFGGVVSGQRVPDRASADTINALLRISWSHELSERLHFDSYLGPTFAHSDTLQRWGAGGRLALRYTGLRTDYSFSAERQLAPAGLGNLTVRDAVSLNMSNRLKEKLSLSSVLSYQRSQEALSAVGTSAYRSNYWRAEESLRWRFAETVSIALAAAKTRQNGRGQGGYADGFVASVGILWTPQPLF
jgi:hypothetical protein